MDVHLMYHMIRKCLKGRIFRHLPAPNLIAGASEGMF